MSLSTRDSYCSFTGVLSRLVPMEIPFLPQNGDPRVPLLASMCMTQGSRLPGAALLSRSNLWRYSLIVGQMVLLIEAHLFCGMLLSFWVSVSDDYTVIPGLRSVDSVRPWAYTPARHRISIVTVDRKHKR